MYALIMFDDKAGVASNTTPKMAVEMSPNPNLLLPLLKLLFTEKTDALFVLKVFSLQHNVLFFIPVKLSYTG